MPLAKKGQKIVKKGKILMDIKIRRLPERSFLVKISLPLSLLFCTVQLSVE
jgi:hypothetical protein